MERIRTTKSIAIAVIVFALSTSVIAQPEWFKNYMQIKVLESSRDEAERILGHPSIKQIRKGRGSETVDYVFALGRLSVSYSRGMCSEDKNAIFNVKKGVVIGADVFLFKPIKITKLKVNMKEMELYIEPEAGAHIYSNEKMGIDFTGGEKRIRSIELSAPEKFDHLRCANVSKPN